MDIASTFLNRFGPERVYGDSPTLDRYSRDFSLSPSGRPDWVIKAKSVEEVQYVLKVAQSYHIPVTPSSSRVHFYGGTIPRRGGIVLDLTEMDRILEIDELNRRVRIEAGVTWENLSKNLGERGLRVMMPLLPHPLRSVITDLLEREVITNTVYEYGEPLQGMEVVWPNGEIFRTGSASVTGYPDSMAQGVNPSGPGIDFYRLLQGAQGTFGVVTWANIKVEFLPKINKLFFIPLSDISRGMAFLSKVLRLRIGQECFLLNRKNLSLALNMDRKDMDESPYALIIVLSGFRRYPEMKIGYEEALLRGVAKEEFPEFLLLEEIPHGPSSNEFVSMLRNPWSNPETYWKHQGGRGWQSLFFITRPSHVKKFIELVGRIVVSYGYNQEEMGIYLQPIEHNRACHLGFDLFYDPGNDSEREKIRRIYREGVERCLAEGALFTRPYGEASTLVFERAPEYARALKRVKAIFDPLHLMNPGKLCF